MRNLTTKQLIAVLVIAIVGVLMLLGFVGYLYGLGGEKDSGTSTSQSKTTDEILEEKFNKVGVNTDNHGDAFEVADAICLDSAGGMYPYSIAHSLTSNNYTISDKEAEEVVEISIRTLCPKFIDRLN